MVDPRCAAVALFLLAPPIVAVAGKGDTVANTLASGERRTALGWTLDGRYLVVEVDESEVDLKEEQTAGEERAARSARSAGICTDYTARSVEIVDVLARRTTQRFQRSFRALDCNPPEKYRQLAPEAAFAQWRRAHPWQLVQGPRSPDRKLQIAARAERSLGGRWRGGRFVYAVATDRYGVPLSADGEGVITFSLRRADRTTAKGVLTVEPVEGAGEVAVIWSPDRRHLALLASEREDRSHHGVRRIHHQSRLFLLPTVGAEAALPVEEPEAAGPPAQGALDATASPRK